MGALSAEKSNSDSDCDYQFSDDDNVYEDFEEPLDLSKNSTTHPFYHPKTPDSLPTKPPMQVLSRHNSSFERQMSIDFPYPAPAVLIQPKSDWHYRNIRDLANKHIPLLSGDGPQRTPIRIQVPQRSDRQMFLVISNLSLRGDIHLSKVIVPAKTKVDPEELRHDNNLGCLRFDECNPADRFNLETKQIYSLITPAEHQAQYKDVRIYMFNLYQSPIITKEVIDNEKLHLSQLSFQLYTLEDKICKPISEPSYSSVIQEKRNNARSRAAQNSNDQHQCIPSFQQVYNTHSFEDKLNPPNVGYIIIPVIRPS